MITTCAYLRYQSIISRENGYLITGRPPDFPAFIITLLMMVLMAAGVKKSLIFNNVLNAINLAVWVFIMTAGLFYVDTDNWYQHDGFLPYGWSGVSARTYTFCNHYTDRSSLIKNL